MEEEPTEECEPGTEDVDEYIDQPPVSPCLAKASNNPIPPSKKSKPEKTRFCWNIDMMGSLIACLREQKSLYEFKGLDFEADLVKLYSVIRIKMAEQYENGFGPISERTIALGLTTDEITKEKAKLANDKKAIKLGYDRVRNKAKEIRQNYRKAITEGQRSGSGKVICDNWEELKIIWGGSPATAMINNAAVSIQRESSSDESEDGEDDFAPDEGDINDADGTQKLDDQANENDATRDRIGLKPAPKFVDNKIKQMKKHLSAS